MDAQRLLSFPPIPPNLAPDVQVWLESLQSALFGDLNSVLQGRAAEVTELPTASEEHRGRLVCLKSDPDSFYVCLKGTTGYTWQQLGAPGSAPTDADTVDQKHAAEFATTTHNHATAYAAVTHTHAAGNADTLDQKHAAEFALTSHTHVAGDADTLDLKHAADFALASHTHAAGPNDADTVDQKHASDFALADHTHGSLALFRTDTTSTVTGAIASWLGDGFATPRLLASNTNLVPPEKRWGSVQRPLQLYVSATDGNSPYFTYFQVKIQKADATWYTSPTYSFQTAFNAVTDLSTAGIEYAGTAVSVQLWVWGNDDFSGGTISFYLVYGGYATSVTGIAYQGGGLIALRPGPNVLTSNTVYIAAGGPIKWRQVWATGSVYFEVNGYTTDSFYPAYFQLYDLTAGAQVVELTTTSTATTTILTSGALSLMDGHLYTVRAKSATMDGGRLVSAYLVVA